jgi:tRNA(Ile)-lysidine synthase
MPSVKKLNTILTEVVVARVCGNPEVQGTDYCVRRYRNKLYCLTSCRDDKELQEMNWPMGQKQLKLDDGKILTVTEGTQGIAESIWLESQVTVKYRKGNEKIRLPSRKGHHTLKKLYQEKSIPPWQRHNIPLIYLNDQLAAIADYWISADFYSTGNKTCYQVVCSE